MCNVFDLRDGYNMHMLTFTHELLSFTSLFLTFLTFHIPLHHFETLPTFAIFYDILGLWLRKSSSLFYLFCRSALPSFSGYKAVGG